MADCHAKVRFATKAFAEQVVREQQRHANYRATVGMSHRAYFCALHSCWHTGNSTAQQRATASTPQLDSIGRLAYLRTLLVAEYGTAQDVNTWRGVRALSGAIRHLQNNP